MYGQSGRCSGGKNQSGQLFQNMGKGACRRQRGSDRDFCMPAGQSSCRRDASFLLQKKKSLEKKLARINEMLSAGA